MTLAVIQQGRERNDMNILGVGLGFRVSGLQPSGVGGKLPVRLPGAEAGRLDTSSDIRITPIYSIHSP